MHEERAHFHVCGPSYVIYRRDGARGASAGEAAVGTHRAVISRRTLRDLVAQCAPYFLLSVLTRVETAPRREAKRSRPLPFYPYSPLQIKSSRVSPGPWVSLLGSQGSLCEYREVRARLVGRQTEEISTRIDAPSREHREEHALHLKRFALNRHRK